MLLYEYVYRQREKLLLNHHFVEHSELALPHSQPTPYSRSVLLNLEDESYISQSAL